MQQSAQQHASPHRRPPPPIGSSGFAPGFARPNLNSLVNIPVGLIEARRTRGRPRDPHGDRPANRNRNRATDGAGRNRSVYYTPQQYYRRGTYTCRAPGRRCRELLLESTQQRQRWRRLAGGVSGQRESECLFVLCALGGGRACAAMRLNESLYKSLRCAVLM